MIKSSAGSEIDDTEVFDFQLKDLRRKHFVIEDLSSIMANSKIQSRA